MSAQKDSKVSPAELLYVQTLKAHLDRTGMSQNTFAKKYAFSPASVSRYLSGQRFPSRQFASGIVDALARAGVPLSTEDVAELDGQRSAAMRTSSQPSVRIQEMEERITALSVALTEAREDVDVQRHLRTVLLAELAEATQSVGRLAGELEVAREQLREGQVANLRLSAVNVWQRRQLKAASRGVRALEKDLVVIRDQLTVTEKKLGASEAERRSQTITIDLMREQVKELRQELESLERKKVPSKPPGDPGGGGGTEEPDGPAPAAATPHRYRRRVSWGVPDGWFARACLALVMGTVAIAAVSTLVLTFTTARLGGAAWWALLLYGVVVFPALAVGWFFNSLFLGVMLLDEDEACCLHVPLIFYGIFIPFYLFCGSFGIDEPERVRWLGGWAQGLAELLNLI